MAVPAKRIPLFTAAGVCLLAAIPVVRFCAMHQEYGEAEPLQPIIWGLADEMKRFAEQRGRPPNDLDEVEQFAPERDFSAVRRYRHEFTSNGPLRFSMRVNKRFGFTIDEEYRPDWSFPKPLRRRASGSE